MEKEELTKQLIDILKESLVTEIDINSESASYYNNNTTYHTVKVSLKFKDPETGKSITISESENTFSS